MIVWLTQLKMKAVAWREGLNSQEHSLLIHLILWFLEPVVSPSPRGPTPSSGLEGTRTHVVYTQKDTTHIHTKYEKESKGCLGNFKLKFHETAQIINISAKGF